jgi:hypothetical protein
MIRKNKNIDVNENRWDEIVFVGMNRRKKE